MSRGKMRNVSPQEQERIERFIREILLEMGFRAGDEDLFQSGWTEFLEVYRRDPDAFSGGPGWERARRRIEEMLTAEKRDRYRRRYAQDSLDQPVSREVPVPRMELLPSAHGDFQNIVCLWDYLWHHGADACRMAREFMGRETLAEIQWDYQWDRERALRTFAELHGCMQEYQRI